MNTRIRDIQDVNELAWRVRVTVVGAKVISRRHAPQVSGCHKPLPLCHPG